MIFFLSKTGRGQKGALPSLLGGRLFFTGTMDLPEHDGEEIEFTFFISYPIPKSRWTINIV